MTVLQKSVNLQSRIVLLHVLCAMKLEKISVRASV